MSPLHASLLFLLLSTTVTAVQYPPLTLTIVNNCPFTIWPAIQPNAGSTLLNTTGFALKTLSHLSFSAPTYPWSGRIWARTHCTLSSNCFSCATGDCGNRVQCSGHGGATPATLAQFSLHHGGGKEDLSSYGVSLVDGFNLPMTVTPHEGKGRCPVVGCKVNLLETCPECLRVLAGGKVVGCKSGCGEFGTDELCCRNGFGSPKTCRMSIYSQFFKQKCPNTFTYAYDTPAETPKCSAPRELKVIFCH